MGPELLPHTAASRARPAAASHMTVEDEAERCPSISTVLALAPPGDSTRAIDPWDLAGLASRELAQPCLTRWRVKCDEH